MKGENPMYKNIMISIPNTVQQYLKQLQVRNPDTKINISDFITQCILHYIKHEARAGSDWHSTAERMIKTEMLNKRRRTKRPTYEPKELIDHPEFEDKLSKF
jgi:hypothetical protein